MSRYRRIITDSLSELLVSVIRVPYNRVRHRLPRTWAVYRGIPARDRRFLDLTDYYPDYKEGLVEAIHEHVSDRRVDLVGLGRGISTVVLLRAGAEAVVAYEGATEMISIAEETVQIQDDIDYDRVSIRHAIVGEAIELYGSTKDVSRIDPAELRSSDSSILVLDCEGAERSIVPEVAGSYDVIICECHPEHGAPANVIRPMLEGYDVDERSYEPERDDKTVIVAERHGTGD